MLQCIYYPRWASRVPYESHFCDSLESLDEDEILTAQRSFLPLTKALMATAEVADDFLVDLFNYFSCRELLDRCTEVLRLTIKHEDLSLDQQLNLLTLSEGKLPAIEDLLMDTIARGSVVPDIEKLAKCLSTKTLAKMVIKTMAVRKAPAPRGKKRKPVDEEEDDDWVVQQVHGAP